MPKRRRKVKLRPTRTIRASWLSPPYPRTVKQGRERKIKSEVTIQRVRRAFGGDNDLIKVCVRIGNGRGERQGAHNSSCAHDKNPRRALKKALQYAAHYIGVRSGAFAGIK